MERGSTLLYFSSDPCTHCAHFPLIQYMQCYDFTYCSEPGNTEDLNVLNENTEKIFKKISNMKAQNKF
jgi:hypothetical protein